MIRMPVIGVRHTYLVQSQHMVFCTLPNVLASQLDSFQCILDDTVEKIINLSPRRIRNCLPAEDDIDCVVPGEVSVSKAYKVCYISV